MEFFLLSNVDASFRFLLVFLDPNVFSLVSSNSCCKTFILMSLCCLVVKFVAILGWFLYSDGSPFYARSSTLIDLPSRIELEASYDESSFC